MSTHAEPTRTWDDARRHRAALLAMTERLIAEHDSLPAGRVIVTVAVCRSELLRTGLRGEGLVHATEAMARSRLSSTSLTVATGFG